MIGDPYEPIEGTAFILHWFDPQTGEERWPPDAHCMGRCVYGSDILMPGDAPASVMNSVAYPDPTCPQHGGHDVMRLDPRPDWIACDQALWALADAYSDGRALEPT